MQSRSAASNVNGAPAIMSSGHQTLRKQLTDERQSALSRYQQLVVGSPKLTHLIRYEVIHGYLGRVPGGLGLWLRKRLFPRLLGSAGKGTIFGDGVVLRHPQKIHLADGVLLADQCVLDARGETNDGLRIGEQSIIGQRAMVTCKNGNITLGRRVGVGAFATLFSVGGNHLNIGDDVLIGPYACLEATLYHHDRTDIPIAQQDYDFRGGVTVGRGAWLGAHVTVLDGVHIGQGAIVGANSLVTQDVPDLGIVMGTPARLMGYRDES
jgi:acetyltransferase-like isoleucine patch superfamily enzyme